MEQLKPCPFCGSKADTITAFGGKNSRVGRMVWCACEECGATSAHCRFDKRKGLTSTCYYRFKTMDEARAKAVELWNRRAGYEDIQK